MDAVSEARFPHVQQSYRWDCGIACLKMILRETGKDEDQMKTFMLDIHLETSVWTIDLAYILSRYGIRSTLHTLNFEVQEDYSSMAYYKDKFVADKVRVEQLFRDRDNYGFTCQLGHLDISDLSFTLKEPDTVIIALVDWNMMKCSHCGDEIDQVCSRVGSALFCMSAAYQGHFILVTDINMAEGTVTFQNPGRSKGPCYCTVSMFDAARTAVGTDEDVLVVKLSS